MIVCDSCGHQIKGNEITLYANLRDEHRDLWDDEVEIRKFDCPACKKEYICSILNEDIKQMNLKKHNIAIEYNKAKGMDEQKAEKLLKDYMNMEEKIRNECNLLFDKYKRYLEIEEKYAYYYR